MVMTQKQGQVQIKFVERIVIVSNIDPKEKGTQTENNNNMIDIPQERRVAIGDGAYRSEN